MKTTVVAATQLEIAPSIAHFGAKPFGAGNLFKTDDDRLHFLVTGMGMMQTAALMALYGSKHDRDLYIDAGIAGAFNRDLSIGDVTNVVSETYGDFGVEDGDDFSDFFEMGFIDQHQDAFEYGKLRPFGEFHLSKKLEGLAVVHSITVNKVHGKEETIARLLGRYQADIENMEGLAFFYVAHQLEKESFQIRSISNYVERRNKDNWDIKKAVGNLNDVLVPQIQAFRAD
jgi:futalosine hydrolase